MKIITKKQAIKISDSLTYEIRYLLKNHGLKLKESCLLSFNEKIKKMLGA